MKILMTGATGLVGQALGLHLALKNHELIVISRSAKKARQQLPFPCEIIEGDLQQSPLKLPKVDAVIHLAGTSVAEGRWTQAYKQSILESRVLGTQHLVDSLSSAPEVFISASAIGFYGDRGENELTENSSAGEGFLSEVCKKWEFEAQDLKKKNGFASVRNVQMRIGIVLAHPQGHKGGALTQMLPVFRYGVGAPLGSGQQWMSWIHIQDLVQMFEWALTNKNIHGPLNAVSPEPVTNKHFSKSLSQTLSRPLGPAVPSIVVKTMYGEKSYILLASQKVLPEKALQNGFQFLHKDLATTLRSLLQAEIQGEEIFQAEQFIPLPPEKLFPFFSEAHNLEKITPDSLNFKIKNVSTPTVQKNTLIDYDLKIHGIPVGWRTEIAEWQPPHKFVDTQIKGPYRLWHHTHEFQSLGGGTLMIDRVRYKLPMGLLGWLAASWYVAHDVRKIFSYRRKVIDDIFQK